MMSSSDKLRLNGNDSTHLQPDRKFYPAPRIAEQVLTVNEKHIPETSDIHVELTPPERKYVRKPHIDGTSLGRELGLFERLYFQQALKGADVISLMMKLESTVQITDVAVRHAINKLMERHPLLRMSVTKDNGKYFMHERVVDGYDFWSTSRADWMHLIKEEFDTPLSEDSGLQWRLRLLNSSKIDCSKSFQHRNRNPMSSQTTSSGFMTSSSRTQQSSITKQSISDKENPTFQDDTEHDFAFRYQATFLFIFNHAITDGGYAMWLFQEFVTFLDAYNMGVNIGRVKQLPLLPPLEHCLNVIGRHENFNSAKEDDLVLTHSYLQFCYGQGNPEVLNMYKHKLHNEIQLLSTKKPKNNFTVCQFDKDITRTFINACKSHGVKANTVVVTASLLAFIDLLYDINDAKTDFEIPFEYMSDTRRGQHLEYDGDQQFLYPGLASLNLPLNAHIELNHRPVSMETFWKISKSIDNALQHEIQTKETVEYYQAEVAKCETLTDENKSKSPFVLCFSNMGKLDGLFNDEVSKRLRLVDLHGQSSILNEDMPIFFVNTFALNGHLFGSVSYCESFTSERTTTTYLGLLQKYLTGYSKL